MVLEGLTASLPGWQLIVFIAMVVVFLLTAGIITFRVLSNLRWPYTYVTIADTAGRGFAITSKKRGKCRLVAFGNGGEELFLLKDINKFRIGYGKRIGPNQVGWVVPDDGLWYQFDFGDFNKVLRELGLRPVSKDVRFGMASVRKGLDNRYENKSFLEKYGPIVYFGMFVVILFIFAGILWYSTNKQVEIARISAESLNVSKATGELNQKTLATIDNILARLNFNAPNINSTSIIGGSGLIPVG